MPQTSQTWLSEVQGGRNVKARHVRPLIEGQTELYSWITGPLTADLDRAPKFRLLDSAAFETVGTFTADGETILYNSRRHRELEAGVVTETIVDASYTGSTPFTLIYNRAWLHPATGAATLTKAVVKLSVGIASQADVSRLERIEILFIKVAADGTETTLHTITEDPSGILYSSGTYASYPFGFSEDFGAGYALAATERLGYRIKLYGRNEATNSAHLVLNASGGPNGAPVSDLSKESWVALTFA